MKQCMRYMLFLPVFLVAFPTFAQGAAPAEPSAPVVAPPETSPADAANFSLRLSLSQRFDITDSTRHEAMDLIGSTGRFGLNYKYQRIAATFEAQAGSTGNAVSTSTVGSNGSTPSSPMSDTSAGQNYFAVRRANVAVTLKKSDPFNLAFVLGRDRLSGSIVYAADAISGNTATNIANQSSASAQDGISLKYDGKYSFGSLNAQVAYYKNLGVTVQSGGSSILSATTIGQADSRFNSASLTGSRAYALVLGSDIKAAKDGVVEVRSLYANQPEATTQVVAISSTTGASNQYRARDLQDIEASVGYNYKKGFIRGGVWFQDVILGRTKIGTQWAGNDIKYVDGASDDSQSGIITYGAGVLTNSKVFGLTDMLFNGDNLTFSAAYQNTANQSYAYSSGSTSGSLCSGATGSTASCQTASIDQVNLAVGYQQANYTLELNWLYTKSNTKLYAGNTANFDGTTINAQDNANMLYLYGQVSF